MISDTRDSLCASYTQRGKNWTGTGLWYGSLPNWIKNDGSTCLIVGFYGLKIILDAVGGNGTHVDDEGTSQLGQISSLLGVIGHDGARSHAEGDISSKVLNDLSPPYLSALQAQRRKYEV